MPEPQYMHSARVLVDSINDQITMHEYKPSTGTLCDKSASFGKFTNESAALSHLRQRFRTLRGCRVQCKTEFAPSRAVRNAQRLLHIPRGDDAASIIGAHAALFRKRLISVVNSGE
jgi:hypothetical protein